MRRLLFALVATLCLPLTAAAQQPLGGVTPPIFIVPASAVNGGGGFSPQLFGPVSCTVPAYSFTTATTNGWGGTTTSVCAVVGGTARQTTTSTSSTFAVPLILPDGDSTSPSLRFTGDTNSGMFLVGDNILGWGTGATKSMALEDTGLTILAGRGLQFSTNPGTVTPDVVLSRGAADTLLLASGDRLAFGGVAATDVLLNRSANTTLRLRLGDNSGDGDFVARTFTPTSSYLLASLMASATAPTVTSAGTSPSIVTNGTVAGRINVGTGGVATTIVLAMPAATTGWNCHAENITAAAANRANQAVKQQSSTTTAATLQNQTVSTGAALAFTASDIVSYICFAY